MSSPQIDTHSALAGFRSDYARQRAAEGRALAPAELRLLPYLRHGPLARQWRVRARTYDAFLELVLLPMAAAMTRPLDVLDLGAGNGWLAQRLRVHGHHALALDVRTDDVDGLGAARGFAAGDAPPLQCVCASFDAIPLANQRFDLVVFNASIHYALDLALVLREAMRVVRAEGRLVILDSPWYRCEQDGAAMVAEKRRLAPTTFGERAPALLALPFIEFLTPARLRSASRELDLQWRRQRVRYPLWYEARPLLARLRKQREPSRFDLWVGRLP